MTSILKELLITENKKDDARRMIKPMIIRGNYSQEDILTRMQRRLGIAPATADTYYHMIVKEIGLEDRGNKDDDDADDDVNNGNAVEDNTPESEEIADIEFDDDGNVVGGVDTLEDGQFAVQGDSNRRGVIRRVEGAHMVYKRRNESGTFDELWIYNTSDNMTDALDIKRNILSATDIPPRETTSADGIQRYSMTTLGDVQYLEINNLPQ